MSKSITVLVILFLFSSVCSAEDKFQKTINIFSSSKATKPFFANAYGYAVFPTIGKGGIGLGGAHGKGRVYRTGVYTGDATMSQLTIGLQAGGQAFRQIIFFQDKRAYEEFINGDFQFGAQATAVAITAGASAQAGTTGKGAGASGGNTNAGSQVAKYSKGMAIFTLAKGGLMYEASVGGQKFKFKPRAVKKTK